jgi:hypothetical protein
MILECGSLLPLWLGKGASNRERRQAAALKKRNSHATQKRIYLG